MLYRACSAVRVFYQPSSGDVLWSVGTGASRYGVSGCASFLYAGRVRNRVLARTVRDQRKPVKRDWSQNNQGVAKARAEKKPKVAAEALDDNVRELSLSKKNLERDQRAALDWIPHMLQGFFDTTKVQFLETLCAIWSRSASSCPAASASLMPVAVSCARRCAISSARVSPAAPARARNRSASTG